MSPPPSSIPIAIYPPTPTEADDQTLQLTVVEDYSGVTAYTRPLLAHLVKGTDWSSATITEPKPFVDISSAYGLRLSADSSYWWLSMPERSLESPPPRRLAPRLDPLYPAAPPGNGSPERPGSLVIVLDNSKGQFASPGEGALASLRFRSRNRPQARL